MSFPFNIRVYGVLIVNGEILLSHEFIKGKPFTKLPGGGLEYGEGLRDCLAREFLEETGLAIHVDEHIYTTDFFQPSVFGEGQQVISVYYRVSAKSTFDLNREVLSLEADQTFAWKAVNILEVSDFSLPIDRHVVPLIKALLS